MIWTVKKFNELTINELYAVIQLRESVFVVEQNCPYLDCDGMDVHCYHLLGFEGNELIAYLRIIPAEYYYDKKVSIGRVVIKPSFRGKNLGKLLFKKGMETVAEIADKACPVVISAQYRLEKFYMELGFTSVGEVYDEDGIPHIKMIGTTN